VADATPAPAPLPASPESEPTSPAPAPPARPQATPAPAPTPPSLPIPSPDLQPQPLPAPPAAVPPTPALPTPNAAPSFTAGVDKTTLEDAGAQSIAGWATAITPGPANESTQNVTFTAAADPALFSTQPAVAPNGTLTYTPAPDANGVATITVAADDGGTANGGTNTSAPSTFTITLTPVNDAPSFSAESNQSAVSLLGAQTVPGWATAITPGPADEASQSVTFTVSNDNPGLFAVQPALAPNGTLTYTPTLLALGSATVTVRAVDNGGTADGGSDTSILQTFTITIL
jgi:hypothetical protein